MSPTKTAKAARHRCRVPWERRFRSARLSRLNLHLLHLPLTPPSLHLPHFLLILRIPPVPQLLLTLPLRRCSRSRRLLLPLRSLLRSLQCRKSLISL